MKLVTLAGPPSCGKTSVLMHVIRQLQKRGLACGVIKFDCLSSNDAQAYAALGIPNLCGLSLSRCPDHFFATSLPGAFEWGEAQKLDYLFTESAGLCNRCSPYIYGALAICVTDNLAGIQAPAKIGPMLQRADVVVVAKGDMVSQAEREVFRAKVQRMVKRACILNVNGLTGQGTLSLLKEVESAPSISSIDSERLRFTMPSALCSYCLGEKRIGAEYQRGNIVSMFDEKLPSFISASGGEAKPVDMSDETKDIATGRAPSSSREVDGTDSEELLLIADKQEEQVDAADTVRPDTPESLTIMGGVDKSGHPEKLPRLDVIPGEIVCILGPTGAGKSRLLDDIECLAQGDTPSCRKILINGDPVPEELRSTMSAQLVAQLSQCMNYVIDMTVEDFLHVHADARRRTGSVEREIRDTFECAVGLAGEPFEGSTRLSQLSGGQSRALMVADAAFLSDAPIVLVDEIENAGMDKWKALATLSRRQKIVLVSTHDPAIALMGTKRVIISNGGMHACLTSSGDSRELENLSILNKIDKKLNELRLILRNGGRLEEPLKDWMAELGRLQEGKAPETRTHLS